MSKVQHIRETLTEQQAFEQFVLRGTNPGENFLERDSQGEYTINVTKGGWACWQARGAIAAVENNTLKALNADLLGALREIAATTFHNNDYSCGISPKHEYSQARKLAEAVIAKATGGK